MVLSDPKEIVMNELLIAVKRGIDRYDLAAAAAGSGRVCRLFEALAALRREMDGTLEKIIRDEGLLPAEPDPDRQSLADLAARIKAAAYTDTNLFLLEDAETLETGIAENLEKALALDWKEDVLRQLRRFEARLHADRERIRELRSEISG